MLGALVEWGGVRSHVSRDRPMPGSCSSSASSAFFLSSPRASLSACADSLRARARPARPMRSNVSALGNTNRCAFISPLKRGQDDAPVVGVERRPGSQVHRCSHVVRRHERTQAEMPDGQPPVGGARCPPGAVAGQRWKGHLDLLGQPRRPGERAVPCRSCQPWPGWRSSAMWSASPRRFSGRRRVPIKSRSSSARR